MIIVAITVLQQRRTEHALAALRDLSSPRALVIRDGVEQRIAGRDVVAGDIVLLREGDRVPADGVLFSATALSVDESILTGESLPVDKVAGSDELARVYSGSLVVRGFGAAEVRATGVRSEIGRIGHALTTLTDETTPLFREVRRVVRWVAAERGAHMRLRLQSSMPWRARTGWAECSPASRSRWASSPKSFPSCSRFFSQWAPGASRARAC